MDRGAQRASIHGIAKSWTRLSDFTFTFHFHALEKDVSENNSLSGYKTCIEALKHPMYTWLRRVTSGLRRCSIQDSRMVIALPILRLHHPGTWNNMTFLISSSSSEFSRSDAGALWCSPPPPQHVGLKRSREFSHGSVLCLGFLFVGGGMLL